MSLGPPKEVLLLLGASGGAAAGLVAAVLWHFSLQERRLRTPRPVLAIPALGLIIALAVSGSVVTDYCFCYYRVHALGVLTASQIDSVIVSDVYDCSRVFLETTDRQAIREFVEACRDVELFFPEHEILGDTFCCRLMGTTEAEIHLAYPLRKPRKVMGRIYGMDGWLSATFLSSNLKAWCDKYIDGGSEGASGEIKGQGNAEEMQGNGEIKGRGNKGTDYELS